MPDRHLPRLERTAVRAILLDPDASVLLLLGRDPADPTGPSWWFTPGGGVDPGEPPIAALRRECWEEVGYVPEELHGPLAHRRYAFPFDQRWLVQETDYYWSRVPAFEPRPQQLTDIERRTILGWRWWRRGALAASGHTVYPEDLTELAEAALGGPWDP